MDDGDYLRVADAAEAFELVDGLTSEQKADLLGRVAMSMAVSGPIAVEELFVLADATLRESATFRAILHGGPFDGHVFDVDPAEFGDFIGMPSPDREITQADVEEAEARGGAVEVGVSQFQYLRRKGTELPQAGAIVHYDCAAAVRLS